jgi:hypothetical protein
LRCQKTKGIGQLLSVGLMALPKSNNAGELNEKSGEESPSSLRSLVVDLGKSDTPCRKGRSGSENIDLVDPGYRSESCC